MFNLDMGEIMVICVVALIVLGPDKLPDTVRALGRAVREFKNAMNGVEIEEKKDKGDETHGRS